MTCSRQSHACPNSQSGSSGLARQWRRGHLEGRRDCGCTLVSARGPGARRHGRPTGSDVLTYHRGRRPPGRRKPGSPSTEFQRHPWREVQPVWLHRWLHLGSFRAGSPSPHRPDQDLSSALGGTRTPNLLIRSQMLYPIELRAQNFWIVPDAPGSTGSCQHRRRRSAAPTGSGHPQAPDDRPLCGVSPASFAGAARPRALRGPGSSARWPASRSRAAGACRPSLRSTPPRSTP
jgi:hypothetical protein